MSIVLSRVEITPWSEATRCWDIIDRLGAPPVGFTFGTPSETVNTSSLFCVENYFILSGCHFPTYCIINFYIISVFPRFSQFLDIIDRSGGLCRGFVAPLAPPEVLNTFKSTGQRGCIKQSLVMQECRNTVPICACLSPIYDKKLFIIFNSALKPVHKWKYFKMYSNEVYRPQCFKNTFQTCMTTCGHTCSGTGSRSFSSQNVCMPQQEILDSLYVVCHWLSKSCNTMSWIWLIFLAPPTSFYKCQYHTVSTH